MPLPSSTSPLVSIVSYCRNERMFVRALLENARMASDHVVLSVGTHLYTGEPEDEDALRSLAQEFPDVRIVRYEVSPALLATPIALHNAARKAGVRTAHEACGGSDFWALLLDGDEVPDGERLEAWWRATSARLDPSSSGALKMANYWYFLDARLVADVHEDSVLLVHSSLLSDAALEHPRERDGILIVHSLRPARNVPGLDGQPMFHHYSWVRQDRASLLRKVANWGHSGDKPWPAMLERLLDAFEAGEWPERDFVHGYKLSRVESRIVR